MDSTAPSLRIAAAQFPVDADPTANAAWIGRFIDEAADAGAHLLLTSETSLPGYAGVDLGSSADYDWPTIRRVTTGLRKHAAARGIWLVLGSAHDLGAGHRPTNCLYLVGPDGSIVDRYDKNFLTGDDDAETADCRHYSHGDRLVTREIRGVRIGLAICYDICWPQHYIAYRRAGAQVMLHAFHNARMGGPTCLDVLATRQIPTRCSDNGLWAVATNSATSHSAFGAFVARPDMTIPVSLAAGEPGILVHDFPDGLSTGGWLHTPFPMGVRDDEPLHNGVVAWSARRDPAAVP